MATRPYKVAVQGAKPRKGEALYRHFGSFKTAVVFAIQQAGAQWAKDQPWSIQNVESGERWNAYESGRISLVQVGR